MKCVSVKLLEMIIFQNYFLSMFCTNKQLCLIYFPFSGTVKVWDPRQRGKPVANMQPMAGESKRDCWTVAFGNSFNDSERIIVAGYDNGDLKMFDLRTMSLRWECNLKNGVSK